MNLQVGWVNRVRDLGFKVKRGLGWYVGLEFWGHLAFMSCVSTCSFFHVTTRYLTLSFIAQAAQARSNRLMSLRVVSAAAVSGLTGFAVHHNWRLWVAQGVAREVVSFIGHQVLDSEGASDVLWQGVRKLFLVGGVLLLLEWIPLIVLCLRLVGYLFLEGSYLVLSWGTVLVHFWNWIGTWFLKLFLAWWLRFSRSDQFSLTSDGMAAAGAGHFPVGTFCGGGEASSSRRGVCGGARPGPRRNSGSQHFGRRWRMDLGRSSTGGGSHECIGHGREWKSPPPAWGRGGLCELGVHSSRCRGEVVSHCGRVATGHKGRHSHLATAAASGCRELSGERCRNSGSARAGHAAGCVAGGPSTGRGARRGGGRWRGRGSRAGSTWARRQWWRWHRPGGSAAV